MVWTEKPWQLGPLASTIAGKANFLLQDEVQWQAFGGIDIRLVVAWWRSAMTAEKCRAHKQ